jgi:hypothetical protein
MEIKISKQYIIRYTGKGPKMELLVILIICFDLIPFISYF